MNLIPPVLFLTKLKLLKKCSLKKAKTKHKYQMEYKNLKMINAALALN